MNFAKVDAQAKNTPQAEMNRATDAKWYLLKVIDLSAQGFSVPMVSQMFDLHADTKSRYIHSPDPLYALKRQRVADLQQPALSGDLSSQATAHPRSDEPPKAAMLVFLDGAAPYWCPDIGARSTS